MRTRRSVAAGPEGATCGGCANAFNFHCDAAGGGFVLCRCRLKQYSELTDEPACKDYKERNDGQMGETAALR